MEEIVTYETKGPVHWIRFNRPEVRNAVSRESADLVRAGLERAEKDAARVVVITGSGGSFCAGADLRAAQFDVADPAKTATPVLVEAYHPLLLTIARLPMPVVAAVDGVAAGIGSDLALACDVRLASERAVFTEIFAQVGLIPDGGGTYTLPRLVGAGRALEMAMTGRKVPAEQALAWGLVTEVYPAEGFEEAVQSYAEELATKAPLSVAHCKQMMRQSWQVATFAEVLAKEAAIQKELFGSQDFIEGVMAFLEKRPPAFKGR